VAKIENGMDGANQKGEQLEGRVAEFLRVPLVTPRRVVIAFALAAAADLVQWIFAGTTLMPIWFDDAVDLVAMVGLWRLLGFHFLLLPAFLAEVVPVVELLPTWVLTVAYLARIRAREQRLGGGVADVEPTTRA